MERKRRSPSSSSTRPPSSPRKRAARAPVPDAGEPQKTQDPRGALRDRRQPEPPTSTASVAEAMALGAVTVKAWSEASAHAGRGHASLHGRDAFRVPSEAVTTHADPDLLAEDPPCERRALRAGQPRRAEGARARARGARAELPRLRRRGARGR